MKKGWKRINKALAEMKTMGTNGSRLIDQFVGKNVAKMENRRCISPIKGKKVSKTHLLCRILTNGSNELI